MATGEGDKNGGSGNSRDKEKAAKKEWCRKHFPNKRTLLEAREIKTQLKTVCQAEHHLGGFDVEEGHR
jgi:ATP-dependent RNA helicase DHX33